MSTKKILIIAIISFIVFVSIIGIIIGVFYFNKSDGSKNEEKEKVTFQIDEIYSNIKDSNSILKCNIVIEVTDKNLIKVFESKNFIIKNEINTIIRGKTKSQLNGSEGQLSLQKEIKDRLARLFDTNDITNVYFDELIVQ